MLPVRSLNGLRSELELPLDYAYCYDRNEMLSLYKVTVRIRLGPGLGLNVLDFTWLSREGTECYNGWFWHKL
jgi:hypothetical protein